MKVRNRAIVDREVYMTISIIDNNSIPLAFSYASITIPAGETVVFMPKLYLPSWSSLGTTLIYANVYTDLPSNGGRPLCPEANTELMIVESLYTDRTISSVACILNKTTNRGTQLYDNL